ncbi:unnamed protein product [Rotaria sp. Silwood2]|nr:unnamed protein product [Rotaria sp. Silwood2]CAF4470937.1 unnamed protein product [Rotaria sp. Silwood2]
MFPFAPLMKSMVIWLLFTAFAVSNVQGQSTVTTRISCPSSQALCGGTVCYDTTTQYCTESGTVIQCIAACGNQCYNSNTQQCMNGTVCSLTQRFCFVKYDYWYGNPYNPPYYQCYDPTYEACFNNTVCSYPSRSCNQRCLRYNEVCLNNVTVCNASNGYWYYQADQIKLCNGTCYDSAIQQCVNIYNVSNFSLDSLTPTAMTTTGRTQMTTGASNTSNCCLVEECTNDADCCVSGVECQCFRRNNDEYGACLNPYVEPVCAKGCPTEEPCRNDTDCCKCQCAQITVTDTDGSRVTKTQCIRR